MRTVYYAVIVSIICTGNMALSQAPPMVSTSLDETEAPGGVVRFIMRNNYTEPMTAYVYEFSYIIDGHLVSGRDGRDAVTSGPNVKPIAPGGRAIGVHAMGPEFSNRQYTFRAAIFADGATVGDAACIQQIVQRRQYAIDNINDILVILRGAIADNIGLDALADQLKSQQDGRRAAADRDTDQQLSISIFWGGTLKSVNRQLKNGIQNADDVAKMNINVLEIIHKQLAQSLPALKNTTDPLGDAPVLP